MDPTPLPVSDVVYPLTPPRAMQNLERRKATRTTPQQLVYLSFGPDNGGIVSNVSDGGLCFNAVAPMQQTRKIHVWFSAGRHKIEAECELAWMDETQRTGGLRFNALSAAAREEIGNWTKPGRADRNPERAGPSTWVFSSPRLRRADTNALPGSRWLKVLLAEIRGLRPLGPFSCGLATGVLISTITGGALLFHAYRRQVGQTLVRWGEHLGGNSQPLMASQVPLQIPPGVTRPRRVSPAAVPTSVPPRKTKPQSQLQTVLPAPAPVMVAAPVAKPPLQTVSPMSAPIQRPANGMPQSPAVIATGKSQPGKLESVAQASVVPATPPTSAVAAPSGPMASKPGDLPQPGSGSRGDIHVQQLGARNHPSGHSEDFAELGTGVPMGRYFELGRFRDEPSANNAVGRVAQAGFHAMVVQKARLWMTSYHVLAGPYANEHEAEAARRNLKSSGFTPRTPRRRSRILTLLSSESRFDGTFFPAGDIVVSWEPYSPDAILRFVKSSGVVNTVHAKWVSRDAPYVHDAIVYRGSSHGSRTLLEIRFSGTSQTLVLTDNAQPIVF